MARFTPGFFAVVCSIAMLCTPMSTFAAVIGERSAIALTERQNSNVAPLTTDRNWINVVLARANYYRALHSAVPFVWSPSQAVFAQQQADKCLLQHSGGPYGENIYWISSPSIDFTQQTNASFDSWMSEQSLYLGPNNFTGALHYTQHVWKNSKRLGCAWSTTTCANAMGGFYFFCE
jgi:pathogenesis-related protein 1